MKVISEIKNCDKFFLRRMLGWIAKELEIPCKKIVQARFDYCKLQWNARHMGRGSFCVSVGDDNSYPLKYKKRIKEDFFADEVELLVYMSSFLIQSLTRNSDRSKCNFSSNYCLKKFREKRSQLIFDWCKPEKIREKKEPVPLLEKRKNKVKLALEMWERKMKLAKTKVAKYKKKLAYYEKKVLD